MSQTPMDHPTESLHPGSRAQEAAGTAAEVVGQLGRIGPYTMVRILGEGGMGTVYLAEQTAPIHRKVALKIIKLGMDTRSVIARFEAEREALALMSHPNVARVFDAGTTEQGRPYFVMEYVEGVPITQYCDGHRLSVTERLELFTQVCRAIQHAHQKGIIHRDIKPSNTLVAAERAPDLPEYSKPGSQYSDSGKRPGTSSRSQTTEQPESVFVKVIDFGIAKATQQKLTEHTFATEQGILIGTPAYMSPEQADLRSTDIDTRTDIYSLGVLLYELLVGSLPFDSEELRQAALTEVVRIVREVDPPKPSSRIGIAVRRTAPLPRATSDANDTSTTTAQSRSSPQRSDIGTIASLRATDSRSLHRQIRGELDWIIMKCLEKDPARRYQSATALIEEIHRLLSHQPVLAGPPSAAHRLRKFVRRNKLPVAAAAGVIVALIAGLTSTSLMFVRAQRERARSEIAAGFLSDILKGAAPAVARGRDSTMLQEMVDSAATRIRNGELKANAGANLMLHMTLGQTYLDLGDLTDALRLSESAVSLACGKDGPARDSCADAKLLVAAIQLSGGNYANSESIYGEVAESRLRQGIPDDPYLARALFGLGSARNYQGMLNEARQDYVRALEIQRRLYGEDSVQFGLTQHSLGMTLLNMTERKEAEQTLRESLKTLKTTLGPDHPSTIDAMSGLGRVLSQTGKIDESLQLLEESVSYSRVAFSADHPRLARALQYLANALTEKQDAERAVPLYREAIEIMNKSVGPAAASTGTLHAELGRVLMFSKRFEEAEDHLQAALDILIAELGEAHPDVALTRQSLARVLQEQGESAKAEVIYRQSLEQVRSTMGDRHFNVLTMRIQLGALQLSADNYEGAAKTFHEACADADDTLGPQHPVFAGCCNGLGLAYACNGDWVRAEPEIRRALDIWKGVHGENNLSTQDMCANLAFVLSALGKFEEAEQLAQSVVTALDTLGESSRPSRYDALVALGTVLESKGRFAEAEEMLRTSYEATRLRKDSGQCSNREVLRRIVELHEAWNRAQPELNLGERAVEWKNRLDEVSRSIEARQSLGGPRDAPGLEEHNTKPEQDETLPPRR